MVQIPGEEHSENKNCPGAATASAVSSGAYSNNSITFETRVPATENVLSEFSEILSPDRFQTYKDECGQNEDTALKLYFWNIEVSSAFWGSFHILEIALRNTIHNQLSKLAETQEWWTASIGLHDNEKRFLNEALKNAKRVKKDRIQPGHVIAELSLGFWVSLLSNKYHSRLWETALSKSFPHNQGTRKQLHQNLESLRKLRNRVAHHEPIFARNLNVDYERLLSVVGTITPIAVEWVKQNSRVQEIILNKNETLSGKRESSF